MRLEQKVCRFESYLTLWLEKDQADLVSDDNHMTEKAKSNELFTISPLPSTTLGVTAVKLQNAKFLLYDTPGICPSAHRIRLLTTMLTEEKRKVKLLFPRKKITPTVFTLDVNHSVLIGSLAQIDYKAVENVPFKFLIQISH